jgi:hypothetical protein
MYYCAYALDILLFQPIPIPPAEKTRLCDMTKELVSPSQNLCFSFFNPLGNSTLSINPFVLDKCIGIISMHTSIAMKLIQLRALGSFSWTNRKKPH